MSIFVLILPYVFTLIAIICMVIQLIAILRSNDLPKLVPMRKKLIFVLVYLPLFLLLISKVMTSPEINQEQFIKLFIILVLGLFSIGHNIFLLRRIKKYNQNMVIEK